MVQLKPEIYNLIVESMLATDGPFDHNTKLVQQQSLARMMQASELLHSICAPYLYKDCLVGNVDLFTRGLEPKSRKAHLLNRVKTLRLHHPFDSPDEPSYSDLLQRGMWAEHGTKAKIQGHSDHLRRCLQDQGFADRFWGRDAGKRMRDAITDGDIVLARISRDVQPGCYTDNVALQEEAFANLERVIMTSTGDQSWGESGLDDFSLPFDADPDTILDDRRSIVSRNFDPKPVPHFLIGLKSTKHYCQTSLAGPMALSNEIIRVVNPPEIVTFHVNNRIMNDGIMPPIVVGALNRYIFGAPSIMICDTIGDDVSADQVMDILHPLRNMLIARDQALCLVPGNFRYSLEDIRPYETTTIELYNYVRHVYIDTVDHRTNYAPSNLKGIRYHLDRSIGLWKGKVTLKNSEDAPFVRLAAKNPIRGI